MLPFPRRGFCCLVSILAACSGPLPLTHARNVAAGGTRDWFWRAGAGREHVVPASAAGDAARGWQSGLDGFPGALLEAPVSHFSLWGGFFGKK